MSGRSGKVEIVAPPIACGPQLRPKGETARRARTGCGLSPSRGPGCILRRTVSVSLIATTRLADFHSWRPARDLATVRRDDATEGLARHDCRMPTNPEASDFATLA